MYISVAEFLRAKLYHRAKLHTAQHLLNRPYFEATMEILTVRKQVKLLEGLEANLQILTSLNVFKKKKKKNLLLKTEK